MGHSSVPQIFLRDVCRLLYWNDHSNIYSQCVNSRLTMPRPKRYDQAELLDAAMEHFWERGYEKTSIGELVEDTGVNRASLYAAYPDKRKLFLAAVEHYLTTRTQKNLKMLRQHEPAADAIRRFFGEILSEPGKIRRGCLVTNSAVEFGVDDEDVARLVRKAMARVEKLLAGRLQEIADAGLLPQDVSPTQYARQLTVFLQGVRVMSRVGVPLKTLREATESALSVLR